ncbi:hypothetical protein BDK88_0708 [Natrinema hispanicum]|uniref:Uncharacterized protein n=1 Tax=Natrinema hispanicum TaxID=392421 RepID=A0A482YG56_9EURY|nr:hypothetical protein BDK88_0708 [Natrinema hispanicum]
MLMVVHTNPLDKGEQKMGVLRTLRGKPDDTGLYECRNCGTKLAPDRDRCSNCNSREIAHYEF